MAKKKTAKRGNGKSGAKKTAPRPSGTPAPLDPIAAALARRRAAMIRR